MQIDNTSSPYVLSSQYEKVDGSSSGYGGNQKKMVQFTLVRQVIGLMLLGIQMMPQ